MPLASDMTGIGQRPEIAIRDGDTYLLLGGTVPTLPSYWGSASLSQTSTQSAGTVICGYSGATIIEVNATAATSGTVTVSSAMETDREFQIYNVSSNSVNVFPPSGGNWNGLSTNASFTLSANKAASMVRISSTRFIYFHSN